MKIILIYLALLALFISCNNQDHTSKYKQIRTEGIFDDNNLETGKWKYFDKANDSLLEEGSFRKGVRFGLWRYYSPYVDSITWEELINVDNSIRISTPNFLKVVEDSSTIIVLKSKNDSRVFNIIIGKGYAQNVKNLNAYKKIIYNDLEDRYITMKDTQSVILKTSAGREYMHTYISGITADSNAFSLFSLSGMNQKGKLIEISLRCDNEFENLGRRVFFSIIPNVFIDSSRFLSTKDNIESSFGL